MKVFKNTFIKGFNQFSTFVANYLFNIYLRENSAECLVRS